jgi:hypothetical protein
MWQQLQHGCKQMPCPPSRSGIHFDLSDIPGLDDLFFMDHRGTGDSTNLGSDQCEKAGLPAPIDCLAAAR